MSDSWLWMTAAELGRGIEAGAIDPRELAEIYLNAIDSHPEGPGIYARTTPDRTRAEADAAAVRARAGLRRGPLDGVPISWKDLYDTAGVATEAGSALLQGRVPERDAAVLATATRAGLVCLGKTHMTELALFGGLGVNPVTATPPNINDPELAPGGSSSGAAASVAFGLAAAAIGSDTSCSVRVPAAWNDLVGLRTTHGLLSLEGVVALCPSFDTVGPLCRSVEDASLLLAALSGRKPADLAGAGIEGARLMLVEDPSLPGEADKPLAALEAATERLVAAGARIERRALPPAAEALELTKCLVTGEAYGVWGETIEARPEVMFAPVRDRFRSGAAYSAPDYVRAWRRLDALRADYRTATADFDALLLPTAANLPPKVDELMADGAYFIAENVLVMRNCSIAMLFGLCALSLPSGVPSCGVMMMAPGGDEARLLRLGIAVERALA